MYDAYIYSSYLYMGGLMKRKKIRHDKSNAIRFVFRYRENASVKEKKEKGRGRGCTVESRSARAPGPGHPKIAFIQENKNK